MSEHVIRVDEATAEKLARRADELGMSVSEYVSALATAEARPAQIDDEQYAELQRRKAAALKAGGTRANEDIVGWLQTWGDASYKPWRDHEA